jgi:hypothetical protein
MKRKHLCPHWSQCGENANWILKAHHYGTNAPNTRDGDWYILEGDEPGEPPFIVVRSFPSIGEERGEPVRSEVRHCADFKTWRGAREYVERAWWSRLYTLTVGYCPFEDASLHDLAVETVRRTLVEWIEQEEFDARA